MNPAEASLLVDVSNSRSKFVLLESDGSFSPVRSIPTSALSASSVKELLQGLSFARATVASVVPQVAPSLLAALDCPIHWLGAASTLNIRVEYAHPEKLGADRLACAIALAAHAPLPAIAVDAGTAVTFDLVLRENGDCVYKGGAIAPGLYTMAHALSARTAQLPLVDLPCGVPALGQDTVGCIRSGLLYGFCGMVDGLLQKLAGICPETPYVMFTGGDADFLAENAQFSAVVDKMLVFKGLAIADRLNH